MKEEKYANEAIARGRMSVHNGAKAGG